MHQHPSAPVDDPLPAPAPIVAATLDESGAARYADVSRAFLKKCRRLHRGPAYVRIGRTIRYLTRDLDAWLASHRIDPSAAPRRRR
jgi:hypothetical protein